RQCKVDEERIETDNVWRGERDTRRERMEDQYKGLLRGVPDKDYPLQSKTELSHIDWAVGAVYRANNRKAMGIFSDTETGTTVRNLAHFLPYRPIFALSISATILAKVALHRGVHLIRLNQKIGSLSELRTVVIKAMEKFNIGEVGEDALAT
ncbi:MAG: pyruvate kinase alpha/beta domain-containing protein, partial [Acidobacteriota bacterium]